MAMIEAGLDTDTVLLQHILSDDYLTMAEMAYPGIVRVHASGRYHARIDVQRCTYNFNIKEVLGERNLVGNFPESDTILNMLVWHRVAEAMLAHRRGHSDARHNKLLRKPKTEQDD